jgi:hypothetical protein
MGNIYSLRLEPRHALLNDSSGRDKMSENEYRRPAVVRTDAQPAPPVDWNAVYEEQQTEEGGPKGGFLNNQFAKIGCGCALPALFFLGLLGSMASGNAYGMDGPAELFGQLTGSIIVGVVACWLPLFLFWLRDGSKWLIGGSFAVVVGLFAVIGLGKIGSGYGAMEKDIAAIGDIKFDAEGNPILPPGMSSSGPVSKMMVEMASEQQALRKSFETDIAKLGIEDMMFADRVARNPSLVQNCARIPVFKAKIEDYRAKNIALIKSIPDRIDKFDMSYRTKTDMKRGAMDKLDFNLRTVGRQWDLQVESLTPVYQTCMLLSKRGWQAQGQLYAFYNQADINRFDGAMREIDRINREIMAVTQERAETVKADQERLKTHIRR